MLLLVYNDLLDLADLLFTQFPTFLQTLNDIKTDEYRIDIPGIPLVFTPLTGEPILIIDSVKYVFASIGDGFCSGYVKQKWTKKAPIVYPVFNNGTYTGKVYLKRKEALAGGREIYEELY
jgi:hypothetical protein